MEKWGYIQLLTNTMIAPSDPISIFSFLSVYVPLKCRICLDSRLRKEHNSLVAMLVVFPVWPVMHPRLEVGQMG